MKEKYLKIKNLSISENLANFINKELLPGTNINKKRFWNGFDKCVHELAPKNRKLLQKRERLQKAIDALHIDKKNNKLNLKKYTKFLIKIGYLLQVQRLPGMDWGHFIMHVLALVVMFAMGAERLHTIISQVSDSYFD